MTVPLRSQDVDKFPLITIVIPAYNEQDYIEYSLRSLTNQIYPRQQYEILVVDNASTDLTAKIAKKWGATVIPEARKGVARARQTGFMAAKGSIIASTDADTAVSPHWLSHISSAFYANPQLGGVYGPVYWPEAQPLDRWALQYPATWVLAASNRLGHTLWWGSNFAVQRDAFMAVGGFSEEMFSGEDTDLSLRMNRQFNIQYDPCLVAYTSPRRLRIGRVRYVSHTVQHVVQRFILRETLPPMIDIR